MRKSHFVTAIRGLLKRKGYALINISGLAIGMACCLLLFQYVSYERSFDKFQPQSSSLVRLRLDAYQNGKLSWKSATIYPAIAPTMKKDFPEVENFFRLHDAELLLSNDDRDVKFNETKGYFADQSAIELLGIDLSDQLSDHPLAGSDKIILSETMAKKYFGKENPVGKSLHIRDPYYNKFCEVTGVFRDYPTNSHLVINYLVSYATLATLVRETGDTSNATETAWGWYDFYTYIQLKPGTSIAQLQSKLPAFCDRYINSKESVKNRNLKNELYLIPFSDIHLESNYNQEAEVNGDGKAVAFIFLIAFLIIGIAWINYINLATSRSTERAREIGVRKVLGAERKNLVMQFMVESFLLNLFSLACAFVIFIITAPLFNKMIGRESEVIYSMSPAYWTGFFSLFIAGAFLSGLYPAFIISGFAPIAVLKGIFKNSKQGVSLRKGLIVGQFVASLVLIAGTIVVFQQVNYMRNQQLGFNMEQTLIIKTPQTVADSVYAGVFQPFKNEVLQNGDVKSITTSSNVMGQEDYWTNGYVKVNDPDKNMLTLYNLGIDYDFISNFGLKLVAGRAFSKDFGTDSSAVLLNEMAVTQMGFANPEAALQKIIAAGGDTFHIIGVLSNFHQQGLQKAIDPMCFRLRPGNANFYSVKIATTHVHDAIASIQASWKKFFPNDPFEYFFMDENFNRQYAANELFGKVFGLFAFLAILIACFGLMGLTAYSVAQRTKEIGVRKVLGASVQNILTLVSKDFFILILIAFLIAIPLGWMVMHRWLEDFAYRISVEWWVFLFAGVIASVIALVTISLQAMRAARANPVKSLRTE